MPKLDNVLEGMARPYQWYGVDLSHRSGDQAYGQCPFCDGGKFYVNIETGLSDCKICGYAGNLTSFLRTLWQLGHERITDYSPLAAERPPITGRTLTYWGVVRSVITDHWLIPGYTTEGKVGALYRWSIPVGESKFRLQAGPETSHYPSGCGPIFDPSYPTIHLCEGFWDGAAWWQAIGEAGISGVNVLTIPGCNTFKQGWASLFAGKIVILLPHNDHPKEFPKGSGKYIKPGFDGMRRVAGLLASAPTPPKEIKCLYWGDEGYTPHLKDGYDLRDHVTQKGVYGVHDLLAKVRPAPKQWLSAPAKTKKTQPTAIEPKPCDDWKRLVEHWSQALRWRTSLQDALSVMLAICLSTDRAGDQLFLQVIGEAGSAKTRLCDGLLISKKCYPLEHLTGFHSGWQDGTGRDFSLLSRVNHKTMVTPEGDVIMASPKFTEIMSQQRRIFDGTSGASYKNQAEDKRWTGLRTPWIMAGTPVLMLETDQSRLGDRFLRICIDPPAEDELDEILVRVCLASSNTARQEANGAIESHMDTHLARALQVTGGYVDFLRENDDELLAAVRGDEREVARRCSNLAKFVADLRSRPNPDKKKDVEASKEQPTRLAGQFTRLAIMLAAVIQTHEIDNEVIRIVAKVAFDTARGKSFLITRHLYGCGANGSTIVACGTAARLTEERAKTLLSFLQEIDVVEPFCYKGPLGTKPFLKWRLTERHKRLWGEVLSYA